MISNKMMSVGGLDNSLVVAGSADGVIRLWDVRFDIFSPSQQLNGHSNTVMSINWNVRCDMMLSFNHM